MAIVECPCKDCPMVGCGTYHDICEKYLSYKAKQEEKYAERKKTFQFNSDLDYIDGVHFKRKRYRRIGVWK